MEIVHRNQFGQLLNSLGLIGNGIEIGVEKGKFSKIIIETSNLKKFYLLDAWKQFGPEKSLGMINLSQKKQDEYYQFVVDNMKIYGNRVVIIKKDSLEAVKDFPDSYFDFVYIDANHDYQYVKTDILNWYPKVKTGGIFSGHDYVNGTYRGAQFGVKRAVDEFCKSICTNVLITSEHKTRFKSWYFIKK